MLDVRVHVEHQNATSAPRTRLQTHAQEDAASPRPTETSAAESERCSAEAARAHEYDVLTLQTSPYRGGGDSDYTIHTTGEVHVG